jgi:CheY-like chemotaxis protein
MAPQNILVADEDIDTRIILRTLLERHGYAVVEAGSPDEAVRVCESQVLSLVILNHPMSLDQQTTLARWLRTWPATCEVPIINLTSRAIPKLIEDASREGVTITLAKPLDVKKMLDLVHELTSAQLAH